MILDKDGKPASFLQPRKPCPYCGSKKEPDKIAGFGRYYVLKCAHCNEVIGRGRDVEVPA